MDTILDRPWNTEMFLAWDDRQEGKNGPIDQKRRTLDDAVVIFEVLSDDIYQGLVFQA